MVLLFVSFSHNALSLCFILATENVTALVSKPPSNAAIQELYTYIIIAVIAVLVILLILIGVLICFIRRYVFIY